MSGPVDLTKVVLSEESIKIMANRIINLEEQLENITTNLANRITNLERKDDHYLNE